MTPGRAGAQGTITRVLHSSFIRKLSYTEPNFVLGGFRGR